ncbi:hypothetical protein LMH81_27650, partial [Vibrio lentus]|nr:MULTISPECIES: hypothetical protein [Vibrio]MCC4820291.1 hypothetical protein [Vibrio lentus]
MNTQKNRYDHSESRANSITKACHQLGVSEQTLLHYLSREGSLEAAIASIAYRKSNNRTETPYTSVRFPFLMPPLWRIALGVPDY